MDRGNEEAAQPSPSHVPAPLLCPALIDVQPSLFNGERLGTIGWNLGVPQT